MRQVHTLFFAFIGFLFLALLVFGSSMQYGFSIIDDQFLIVNNLFVHSLSIPNLVHIFTTFDPELYIPFTLLSFQINYLLGGLNAGIYHFTNIFLHAANAMLVFWITGKFSEKKSVGAFAALLFLLHPINTEAVVWVTGRKDVLATFFALLSVRFFLLSSRQGWHSDDNNETKLSSTTDELRARFFVRAVHPYALSILFFLFALLSKASVMTLPIVLLLLEVSQGEKGSRSLKKIAPFLALSILFGVIALFGKARVVGGSGLSETVLMATKSTLFYLQKLVLPTGLNPFYPYHDHISLVSPDFWLPMLGVVLLTGLSILSLRKTKWVFFSWVAFLFLLAPSFLNFNKGSVTFFAVDRYVYFPSIVLFILSAFTLHALYQHFWRQRKAIIGLSVLLLILLAWRSIEQTKTWKSNEVMLKRSLLLYPDSVAARTSLASLYRETGDMESEELVLKQGEAYRKNIAYTLGIGSIEERKGNFDTAQTYYEEARLLDSNNPEPLFFIAALSEREGGTDHAKILYKQAIDLDPSYVSPMINLGAILSDEGKLGEAEMWFKRALSWTSGSFELQYNLGKVLEEQEKKDEALQYFANAYALNPEDADIVSTYAYRLYEKKEYAKAKKIVEKFLETDAENRTVTRLLGLIEAAQ